MMNIIDINTSLLLKRILIQFLIFIKPMYYLYCKDRNKRPGTISQIRSVSGHFSWFSPFCL